MDLDIASQAELAEEQTRQERDRTRRACKRPLATDFTGGSGCPSLVSLPNLHLTSVLPSGARRAETCSYQKFKKVERSLVVYIRAHETCAGEGILQNDVIEWYLNRQVRSVCQIMNLHVLSVCPRAGGIE